VTNLLHDKKSTFQLFAGLMANPDILANTKEYKLSTDDFPEQFHKIIFGAIYNLQKQGIEKITRFEVDNALSAFPNQYRIYNENNMNGNDYLLKVEEFGSPENFNLHYDRIKKFSFLRSCEGKGIDITDIYDKNEVGIKETEAQQYLFDTTPLDDMIRYVEDKFLTIKDEFLFNNGGLQGSHASDGLMDILIEKMQKPSYGASFSSGLYTAATRGARRRKVYLNSAPSGTGKSRFAISSMLALCVPEIWDSKLQQWVQTGATGRCCYIGTELEEEEVKIPMVCYVADIPEDKINDATLTFEEQERVLRAVEILKMTPFWFEPLDDFDLSDIEHAIVKNINRNQVDFISFDYIHTSMKLLASMSKFRLQEHQVLLQMSIRIKELANKYDVFIMTATQLNGTYKDGDMDDNSLSGAKSIAQKVDIGSIMLNLNEKDEAIIDSIMSGSQTGTGKFCSRPNMSINLYKNRGNKWKLVRLWINFNLGTLRIEDCFATNYKGEPINDLESLYVVFDEQEEMDLDSLPEGFRDYLKGEDVKDALPDVFNEIAQEAPKLF